MKLTKHEARREFNLLWANVIATDPNLRGDHIAKMEEWNNFTDYLHKDGRITTHQYETWTYPY